MKKRHAYLLLVHKNPIQVSKLLSAMDCENVDFFIHIDAKAEKYNVEYLEKSVKKSKIYFTDRIIVDWGRFNTVEATLILLKKAVEIGGYSYLHLISGQDFPLKNIYDINEFYDSRDSNNNYVHLGSQDWIDEAKKYRRAVYLLDDNKVIKIFYKFKIKKINNIIHILQKKMQLLICNSLYRLDEYAAGSNWIDLNYYTAKLIVENEKWIINNFKYDTLAEEAFIQTFFRHFNLESTIYRPNDEECEKGYSSYMRQIDWSRSETGAHPWTYKADDFDMLINSGSNFGRKFDMDVDAEIIENCIYM